MDGENSSAFDAYAEGYDDTLNAALAVTGETRDYYLSRRMSWMKASVPIPHWSEIKALDFGCGTGKSIPHFFETLRVQGLIASDISRRSLSVVDREYGGDFPIEIKLPDELIWEEVGFVYVNGVFHHIPVVSREETARKLWNTLRPNGWLAFWENNPLNPGTRFVMRHTPFDSDAVPLYPWESLKLLNSVGFEVSCVRYVFFFPSWLRRLRTFEGALGRLPLGGQYVILARKSLLRTRACA